MRYEPMVEPDVSFCEEVRLKNFINLDGAKILYVFDTKKKVNGGRIAIARIKKMNDEMRFLAMNDMGLTYDYIVFVDKAVWEVLDNGDRERIIFHEFCHCKVDFNNINPYGIQDHEIQGFYCESDFNSDDPRWSERIGIIAESIYDPEKNETEIVEG